MLVLEVLYLSLFLNLWIESKVACRAQNFTLLMNSDEILDNVLISIAEIGLQKVDSIRMEGNEKMQEALYDPRSLLYLLLTLWR